MTALLSKDSIIRFSKVVVLYCMIIGPLFTATVMTFNWFGIIVQTEIVVFFGAGFLGHLITLAWVTVTKEKCNCEGRDEYANTGNYPQSSR